MTNADSICFLFFIIATFFQPNDPVIVVPKPMLLTPTRALQLSPLLLGKLVEAMGTEVRKACDVVSLFLVLVKHLKNLAFLNNTSEYSASDSTVEFWVHYVCKALPTRYDTLIHWTSEELQEVQLPHLIGT